MLVKLLVQTVFYATFENQTFYHLDSENVSDQSGKIIRYTYSIFCALCS